MSYQAVKICKPNFILTSILPQFREYDWQFRSMRKTFTKDFKLISKFLRYLFHLFPGLYMHIFNMLLFLSIDSFLGGLFSEFNQYLLPYGFFGGVGVGRDWLTFGGERIQKNWCCECDPEVNLHYVDVCLCCPGNTA